MPVDSGSYTPETLERRRRMAEALVGRSMQGAPVGSHLQGLAQIASTLVGTKMMRDVEKAEVEEQKRSEKHVQKLARALVGGQNPENFEAAEFNAQSPGELQMVETTAQRMPDRSEALQLAMAPEGARAIQGNPVLTQMLASQLNPREAESFTLGPGQTRYDASGRQIASMPSIEKPDKSAIGSINPSDFTPESLARFSQSGNWADLQRMAPKPEKAPEQWKTLTPEEVAASGLPAGTSAERNVQTNETRLLSKRDTTASLSQKDATNARLKLNQLSVAKQQLSALRQSFDEGRQGMNAFGPGQGMLPTQAGKLFDARVDQLRDTIASITRVPGIGAQSDYEARLSQAKMPARTEYETVTEDKIRGLEDMLALIENGYAGLLSGGTAEPSAPSISPRSTGQPVQVQSDADYDALPSGAEFVGPDGVRRRKP